MVLYAKAIGRRMCDDHSTSDALKSSNGSLIAQDMYRNLPNVKRG